ncbi:type I restriction-modification system subunit M [Metamycoplasma sualvi]|uniref:type I restriction-modification system subunit M n=1 Tax=Metamycoplasma sualvi TaxID=2125 RepID=UPI003873CB9F
MKISSANQKNELFKHIWNIAEELRGKVDGWDFKGYVLGFLFYKYISENLCQYINKTEWESGNKDFDYAFCNDNEVDEEIKSQIIEEKGLFIYPSQLFSNLVKNASKNIEELNIIISNNFREIEASAIGTKSEDNVKGIFSIIKLDSNDLGNNVISRNKNLLNVINKINELDLGDFKNNEIDLFGDAYEFLMSMYASQAGKAGGEYFTPQEVSKLLTKLAIGNKKEIKNVYDPACGSGSLLLQAAKLLGEKHIIDGFYGQDSNPTTYNLCRINMFLHNINFANFNIQWGDTLVDPQHDLDKKYEVIVSNPPYSIKWEGDDNITLINDERFSSPGVLAPKSKADFAFILHSLHLLDVDGKAAIVCFPGIFYRGGAEAKIRDWLIKHNYIDLIISLPSNLFYGTSIQTNIMVLSKSKQDKKIMFIDASQKYIKQTNQNILGDETIDLIVDAYLNRKEIGNFSKLVDIDYDKLKENDFDLSVNNFIEDTSNIKEEKIDIVQLNKSINEIVKRNDELRKEIDLIIEEIGNEWEE